MKIRAVLADWWKQHTQIGNGLILLSVAILVFSLLVRIPTADQSVMGALERQSFDVQMQLLRTYFPRPAKVEPVLIGVDENAEEFFDEPLAMWHRHFAKTLDALRGAKPAIIGIDIQMPSRSFDHIMPGLDLAFLASIARLKATIPLAVVHTFDRAGNLARIHPTYHRVLEEGDLLAIDRVLEDEDRSARRFNERAIIKEGSLPPFAAYIARRLGREPGAGYIDFSIGDEVRYIPIQQVIAWNEAGNVEELKRRFEGRVVLLGSVTKAQDRWKLPVGISNWERLPNGELSREQPGIMVHLQSLRSILGDGLLVPMPDWLKWLVCAALLGFAFVPSNRRTYIFAFVVAPVLIFGISVTLITAKILIPALTFLVLLWISVMVGAIADAAKTLVDKNRLRNSFEGSVSPAVMEEMLAGNLSGGVSAKTADVCVMFTDIRGFTALSEALSPEEVTGLLTRYFDRMVACVHRCEGTMDKFMGDGMMVFFGAPRSLANPCENAVRCAVQMVQQLKELNLELEAEGLPRVEIGIGINYGKVVVGNIGSTVRHNYSAIGDAVNVASRVEGMTKRLGRPIVFTDSVRARLGTDFDMIDFGEQAIRGHSPMRLWGVSAASSIAPAQH